MLDQLVIAFISPLGTSLTFGLMAILLAIRGRNTRFSFAFGAFAFVWLYLWSLPIVSHQIRSLIESQYPPVAVDLLPSVQAIVVLGGSIEPARLGNDQPHLVDASDRIWHAARLYKADKAPYILLSGGSDRRYSSTSEAAAMRQFLCDLGVPDASLLLEEISRNTRQNAQFTSEILRQRGINQILLVTSALHMKRALVLFQAHGLTVTPASTDHVAPYIANILNWVPSAGALDVSARSFKEIIGLLVSR